MTTIDEAGTTIPEPVDPDPVDHQHVFFRTSLTDQYKNFLYVCSCTDNQVTGPQSAVRQHMIEKLVDGLFMGDVRVGATGFTPTDLTPQPPKSGMTRKALLELISGLSD